MEKFEAALKEQFGEDWEKYLTDNTRWNNAVWEAYDNYQSFWSDYEKDKGLS